MTLVCEDANSKLVSVADVGDEHEDRVGNSLLQIWNLRFGKPQIPLLIKINFCSDFEHKVWSRF